MRPLRWYEHIGAYVGGLLTSALQATYFVMSFGVALYGSVWVLEFVGVLP